MDVAAHYQHQLDPEALLAAVDRQLGAGLTPAQLAPIDQLHLGGRRASLALLEGITLGPASRVLDLGAGLGGTARLIAEQRCQVIGLDITARFCQLARQLSRRLATPLPAQFVQGDAQALPFADHSFDLVVSQHCLMNLPELPRALAEIRRVLCPNGCVVLHELLAGPAGAPHFPTPWASLPEQSHLLSEASLRTALTASGLQIDGWRDLSQQALAWRSRHGTREQQGISGLSPALVYGPRFRTLANNLQRSLAEARLRVVQIRLSPR